MAGANDENPLDLLPSNHLSCFLSVLEIERLIDILGTPKLTDEVLTVEANTVRQLLTNLIITRYPTVGEVFRRTKLEDLNVGVFSVCEPQGRETLFGKALVDILQVYQKQQIILCVSSIEYFNQHHGGPYDPRAQARH